MELVVDQAGLTVPSTRRYLSGLLGRLEAESGIKVRVICPPPGLRRDRARFGDFMGPLTKSLGLDQNSVVIVAELQAEARSGRLARRLLNLQMGTALQQRFQYAFNNDFMSSVANRFGSQGSVDEKGTDGAIREATENIAAALYSLVDRESGGPSRSLFTKPWYRSYVPAEDVASILGRHSA